MKKIDRKIFYALTTALSFIMGNISAEATDYKEEAEAAAKGRNWYDQSLIPSQQEIQGCQTSDHIKIRLPLDLERIINEYREIKKPVSVAVACGDRELPWRANFAAEMNDSNSPSSHDYWEHLATYKIEHNFNNENYISIDPFLGIQANENEDYLYRSSGRGAGHFHMNAMDPEHWGQFTSFLAQNNVQLHQIIFTTSMGDPQSSLDQKDTILSTQLKALAPGGKLVTPYFLTYDEKYSDKNFNFLSLLPRTEIDNGWELHLSSYSKINTIFTEENSKIFIFNDLDYVTRYMPFIELCQKHSNKEDIKVNIRNLVEQHFSSATEAHKTFLIEMADYFISITNLSEVFKSGLTKPSYHSQLEQIRNVIPIYKKYFENVFKEFELSVEFLTSPKTATVIDIPEVKAQDWQKGDYPYGESNHIALVLQKINN